ncbi:hypothetical protein GCM10009799_00410 [Nocardiopsis rhodophaea]|uniref:Uncharacterized protein n=1 Tax=Nocardiopsis rhodophaea TaxID=280238 RepID=A0ABN2S2D6_9ACTN
MGTGQWSVEAALAEAERMRGRSLRAARWFRVYLVVAGLLAVGFIVGLEALYPNGWERYVVIAVWGALTVLAGQWVDRRGAFPVGGRRRFYIAGTIWLLLYLVGIGPLVRWQFDTSLPMWTVASLVMALPFFIAACWRVRV